MERQIKLFKFSDLIAGAIAQYGNGSSAEIHIFADKEKKFDLGYSVGAMTIKSGQSLITTTGKFIPPNSDNTMSPISIDIIPNMNFGIKYLKLRGEIAGRIANNKYPVLIGRYATLDSASNINGILVEAIYNENDLIPSVDFTHWDNDKFTDTDGVWTLSSRRVLYAAQPLVVPQVGHIYRPYGELGNIYAFWAGYDLFAMVADKIKETYPTYGQTIVDKLKELYTEDYSVEINLDDIIKSIKEFMRNVSSFILQYPKLEEAQSAFIAAAISELTTETRSREGMRNNNGTSSDTENTSGTTDTTNNINNTNLFNLYDPASTGANTMDKSNQTGNATSTGETTRSGSTNNDETTTENETIKREKSDPWETIVARGLDARSPVNTFVRDFSILLIKE